MALIQTMSFFKIPKSDIRHGLFKIISTLKRLCMSTGKSGA